MAELPDDWEMIPVHVRWPPPNVSLVDVPGGVAELQTSDGRRLALVDDDLVVDLEDHA
jgi:hypothetical protein